MPKHEHLDRVGPLAARHHDDQLKCLTEDHVPERQDHDRQHAAVTDRTAGRSRRSAPAAEFPNGTWQRETATYFGELQRHGIRAAVLNALPGHDRKTGAERAKRAVACLWWMAGVPISQIEVNLMRHMGNKDAAGAARAAADRTQGIVATIIEIARCLHPSARLDELARLLPVQLEFGIPAELVPLAQHAGTGLDRTDYLHLARRSLVDPAVILDADDGILLACLNGSTSRLAVLRQSARAARDGSDSRDFADLLPASTD